MFRRGGHRDVPVHRAQVRPALRRRVAPRRILGKRHAVRARHRAPRPHAQSRHHVQPHHQVRLFRAALGPRVRPHRHRPLRHHGRARRQSVARHRRRPRKGPDRLPRPHLLRAAQPPHVPHRRPAQEPRARARHRMSHAQRLPQGLTGHLFPRQNQLQRLHPPPPRRAPRPHHRA